MKKRWWLKSKYGAIIRGMKAVFSKKFFTVSVRIALGAFLLGTFMLSSTPKANAACVCADAPCLVPTVTVPLAHELGRETIATWIAEEFNGHRDWLVDDFFELVRIHRIDHAGAGCLLLAFLNASHDHETGGAEGDQDGNHQQELLVVLEKFLKFGRAVGDFRKRSGGVGWGVGHDESC